MRLVSRLENSLYSPAKKTAKNASSRASIVITTFAPRFTSHAIPTLKALREAGVDNEIFLVINGDQAGRFDRPQRDQFLQDVSTIGGIYPICFGTGRGMAEMWNAGIRFANSEKNIILNEDLLVSTTQAKACIEQLEHALDSHELVVLNESFGHFALRKSALVRCNWFDERFLGFGEEDGDFLWVFEKTFNKKPQQLYHAGLNNASSEIGYEGITSTGKSKYSQFNYLFLRRKYRFGSGEPQGLFGSSAEQAISSPMQYPNESFRSSLEEAMHSGLSDSELIQRIEAGVQEKRD